MSEINWRELSEVVERELALCLEKKNGGLRSKRLDEALAYAFSTPAKRLRPLMVLTSALASRGETSPQSAISCGIAGACAVEFVHTYSLIHDDLPCMDDDDYRRGRPSMHRQFDEALAVLAGDALLADAFLLLSSAKHNAVEMIKELALTAGSAGLVAGQAEDLIGTTTTNLSQWLIINSAKTARLFEACAVIGGLSVGASTNEIKALRAFGHHFGMAFQIKDDVDDASGLARLGDKREITALLKEHLDAARYALSDLKHRSSLEDLIHLAFAMAV